ncbi:RNA-directed DNA polymerase [Sporosarcina sp. P29]|uniref:RNA-directed DNA polymerase n=1 Tax=Sporosarcina sp. P29 TaxID=2048252 RepID=UPI0018EDFD7E|nr:RNA-directed DNA polymerase [Sporosarcina sp. P29]
MKDIDRSLSTLITVPLFFHIPKSKSEKRKIGLLHPIAQIQTFDYILKYEQLITSFCKNSPYSVRSPIKRNVPKISMQQLRQKELTKIEEEYSFTDKISVTSDEDQILFYNYFSYNKFKKIQNLYNSPKFNRDKYKYSYFLKLDIQRCFPSIYTHSLAWAIFGDKSLAKRYKKNTKAFPNASDIISQKINFNETHGLVVGPEFSRVIAELLLTRIDINLQRSLNEKELLHKKHYSLYRFVDDYFLFSHRKEDIIMIENDLKKELDNHNLTLNVWKSDLQEKPFVINDDSIIELKKILKEFDLDKKLSVYLINEKKHVNKIKFNEYKGTRYQWDTLFNKIEMLVSMNYSSKTKIVNFFLKSIRSSISFDGKHPYVVSNILEIVSNIYTLDINNKSTTYIIAIYFKILNQTKNLKSTYELQKSKITNNAEIELIQKKINDCVYTEDKIFQYSFNILKNNIEDIENMYDLLIFMKLLDKKLASSFLCAILESNKCSYFVCCSVGYYILNYNSTGLDMRFLTVSKKLVQFVTSIIQDYTPMGADYLILEAEFFYFLNDFSKYPGFQPSFKSRLTKRLVSETRKTLAKGNPNVINERKNIWSILTRHSYYQWSSSANTFVRKIIKKSSNSQLENSIDY